MEENYARGTFEFTLLNRGKKDSDVVNQALDVVKSVGQIEYTCVRYENAENDKEILKNILQEIPEHEKFDAIIAPQKLGEVVTAVFPEVPSFDLSETFKSKKAAAFIATPGQETTYFVSADPIKSVMNNLDSKTYENVKGSMETTFGAMEITSQGIGIKGVKLDPVEGKPELSGQSFKNQFFKAQHGIQEEDSSQSSESWASGQIMIKPGGDGKLDGSSFQGSGNDAKILNQGAQNPVAIKTGGDGKLDGSIFQGSNEGNHPKIGSLKGNTNPLKPTTPGFQLPTKSGALGALDGGQCGKLGNTEGGCVATIAIATGVTVGVATLALTKNPVAAKQGLDAGLGYGAIIGGKICNDIYAESPQKEIEVKLQPKTNAVEPIPAETQCTPNFQPSSPPKSNPNKEGKKEEENEKPKGTKQNGLPNEQSPTPPKDPKVTLPNSGSTQTSVQAIGGVYVPSSKSPALVFVQ